MSASTPAGLRESVIRSIARQTAIPAERLRDDIRIVEDLHLDGDDVSELIEELAKEFAIDLSGYRWYHHHGPEGCNPFWLLCGPWRMRATPHTDPSCRPRGGGANRHVADHVSRMSNTRWLIHPVSLPRIDSQGRTSGAERVPPTTSLASTALSDRSPDGWGWPVAGFPDM